ncbi:DUF3047 domain-containing protein [Thaumasiovibrio subtropicus]|uniref:DUF3047 domain-containing protein n=1 Tax=Thaumasiovibrio subtropicus TaxID=1891207 RepID=UPI000B35F0C5|nr:DUF3047 domain-containing protein [Thaumasiovibrio subtropicus]
MIRPFLLGILLISSFAVYANQLHFLPKDMLLWEQKAFGSETDYRIEQESVFAHSEGGASGLFNESHIDLTETPILTWHWKPAKFPQVKDERLKEGDDFALRVYVVAKTGFGPWGTKAISYVWSQTHRVGENWPNPFAGERVVMLALRDSNSPLAWQKETRNIAADFERFFDEPVTKIHAVAIMTDGDNSASVAAGYYGELLFTAETLDLSLSADGLVKNEE